MMAGKRNPYEDILHLPHHKASNRPQMSLHDRAAQFSPFAALSGFDGVIAETGRLTGRRKALTEEEKERLNRKLALIADRLREGDHPLVTVTFFVPDALKDGGEYLEYAGRVRKIEKTLSTLIQRPVSFESGLNWFQPNKAFESGFTFAQ